MTEKQLSRYYYLKKDIKDLEIRINEIKETGGISGIQYKDDVGKGSGIHKSIQDKLTDLMSVLLEKRVSALEEYLKIENFMNTIEDSEIRLIIKYRFMDRLSWNQVADKLCKDDKIISEDAPRKKLKRFLEKL